jgi:hypothetical protein
MFTVAGLLVAAYRAAARRGAAEALPYISDHVLRDIGLTHSCVVDSHRTRTPVLPFGPFGLPIEF